MDDNTVGFGESSRRHRTVGGNAFCRFETTPVMGGADVVLVPQRGFVAMPEVDVETGRVTVRLRKEVGPQVGRRVKLNGVLIEVAERQFAPSGTLMLRDALLGGWHQWR